MANRHDSAHTVALQALGWLAADDARLSALLAAGGLEVAELRRRASDPLLLAAVLEFLLADERMLLDFCADAGLPPEAPMRARQALPGGNDPFWT